MSLNIEDQAKRARELLEKSDIKEIMSIRCEEENHNYENCCSAIFQVYQKCKWCGKIR